MAVMVGVVGSMSAFYFDESMKVNNQNHRKLSAQRLIAKVQQLLHGVMPIVRGAFCLP